MAWRGSPPFGGECVNAGVGQHSHPNLAVQSGRTLAREKAQCKATESMAQIENNQLITMSFLLLVEESGFPLSRSMHIIHPNGRRVVSATTLVWYEFLGPLWPTAVCRCLEGADVVSCRSSCRRVVEFSQMKPASFRALRTSSVS